MLTTPRYFQASSEFSQGFGQTPFLFEHGLAQHELLSTPALKRLVERMAAITEKHSKIGRFRQVAAPGLFAVPGLGPLEWGTPEFQDALNKAFENLDTSHARIKLSSIHQFPEYRELLDECTRSLSEVTGIDFARDYETGLATLFISSPGQLTPYHFDSEFNFLLQIRGVKEIHISDGNDRSVVSHTDLENYWTGNSSLQKKPDTSFRTFDLAPGLGVHNPPFFPHWVEVGPNASISLSLGYNPVRFERAEVYRMNAYLRRAGLTPTPPGTHPGIDKVKSSFIHSALSIKRATLGD
jgi:hypothetical protein